jgi:hypothetical protein
MGRVTVEAPSNRAGGSKISSKEKQKLHNELWIVIPFFLTSLFFFVGSFEYKFRASVLPMLVGLIMAIVTAMRLFYIFFPTNKFKLGEFKEGGLAGEFDGVKESIEKEVFKEDPKREISREITARDERKAFIALIGCFLGFLLFGYLVGVFVAIVGVGFYYGYREKLPLVTSLISMYFIVYVVLYKLLGAPEDFGLVLDPILRSLNLI